MKRAFILLTSLSMLASSAFATKLLFPDEDNAQFNITIPDNWKPETTDGVLEAQSPDESVYLAIWELESKKDAESLGDDINEMLKDHAKNIKLTGKGEKAKVGGTMDGTLFTGTAKDKEDGSDITFFALIFSPKKDTAAVIFIESGAETSQAQADKLTKILKSIKAAKE